MDARQKKKIEDLVARFEQAASEAERSQIRSDALSELGRESGEYAEFERLVGMGENQRTLANSLLSQYLDAGNQADRQDVVAQAAGTLSRESGAYQYFFDQIGSSPPSSAAPSVPAATDLQVEETPRRGRDIRERAPESSRQPTSEAGAPITRPSTPSRPSPTSQAGVSDGRYAAEGNQELLYFEQRYGGDPEQIRRAVIGSMQDRLALQRIGITGETALNILSYYQRRGPGELQSEIASLRRDRGASDEEIRDFIRDVSSGVDRTVLTQPAETVAIPRLVQQVDENGNPVGDPQMTQSPGIVQSGDLTLRRNADGSLFFYPSQTPTLFLNELNASQLASFKERLYEYFGTDMTDPMAVQQQTSIVLQEANRSGKDLELLFADYDRQAGIQLDASGRRMPKMTRPIEYTPTDVVAAIAEQVATEQLGRALTAEEKAGIVNEYKMIEQNYAFDRRRAEIKAAAGGLAEIPQQPLSVDTAVDRWLRENRKDQMRVADQMPHYEALFDMWQNGDFNV